MNSSDVADALSYLRRPLAIFLGVLLLLDGITTYIGISMRNLSEGNPMMIQLMQNIGDGPTIILTTVLGILALGFHELLISKKEHLHPLMANIMGHIVLVPLSAMYTLVVYNNLVLIFG